MLPKFEIKEDVTIYFKDKVSNKLHNYVCSELNKVVPTLDKNCRTLFHLEQVINTIFSNAAVQRKLVKNKSNEAWTIRR
jgi:hypothetical protein